MNIRIGLVFLAIFWVITLSAQNKTLDSLEKQYQNTTKDTTKAMLLTEIAYLYININPDTTLLIAQKAYAIAEKVQFKKGMAWALNRLGIGYDLQGNYPLAVESLQKSLVLFESLQDQIGIASCLNSLGIIYDSQENFTLALQYYQKALKIYRKINKPDRIAITLNNIGYIYKNQKKYDLALKNYAESLQLFRNLQDEEGIGMALGNAGEVYLAQKKYDLALKNYEASLKIREKIQDKYGAIYALTGLAKIYQAQKKYAQSLIYAENAFRIAQELQTAYELAEISKILYENHKQEQNFDESLKFLELYQNIRDSILSVEKLKIIDNLENKAQLEKKDLQIKQAQQAKDFQKKLSYGIFMALILSLIFTIIAFILRRKEIKAKEIILIQKEELNVLNEELKTTLYVANQQKNALEEQSKEIRDSMLYAQRIQQALLPFESRIMNVIGEKNFFIYFKPQNIVSGDFYYFEKIGDKIILAAVDCTGHGIPGAFMSMIGIEIMNEIVKTNQNTEPNKILEEMHQQIRFALKQKETKNQDGMDISLAVIDKTTKTLSFAGAKNPLIYIQKNTLHYIKGDIFPIGGEQREKQRHFTKHIISLENPTTFYLFSDGYQDQFGGLENKKFMLKNLKNLLLQIHQLPMLEQQKYLKETIENWQKQGNEKQIDDILVMGISL